MIKKILFLLLICFDTIFCRNFHRTKPLLLDPQCDPFINPLCITYPKEGQIFVADKCIKGCALCICNNGFSCTQRVLSNLTVKGTTRKPNQVVVVVLINTKLTTINTDLTLEQMTTSEPAPDGTGVWSVNFTNIPTPKPPPFKHDGLPTTISVSVNSKLGWNISYATRSIYIKKDKDCNLDCDIACRAS